MAVLAAQIAVNKMLQEREALWNTSAAIGRTRGGSTQPLEPTFLHTITESVASDKKKSNYS